MNINITEVMKEVRRNKELFHSEAELQFEIGYVIRKLYKEANVEVFIEYPAHKLINYKDFIGVTKNKIPTIDIVVKLKEELIPIEIKYITSNLTYDEYILKGGNGEDKAFFYVTDIHRIEAFIEQYESTEGYAILISNNSKWFSNSRTLRDSTFNYSQYYLADNNVNVLQGNVAYKIRKDNTLPKDLDKKFTLLSTTGYPTKWSDYSTLISSKNNEFKMLISTVHKEDISS